MKLKNKKPAANNVYEVMLPSGALLIHSRSVLYTNTAKFLIWLLR